MSLFAAVAAAICFVGPASAQDRADKIWSTMEEIVDRRLDLCWHAGFFEDCVMFLRFKTGMHPRDPQISADLAYMLINVERYDEAVAEARRLFGLDKINPVFAENLADLYYRKKNWPNIIETLAPVIEKTKSLSAAVMLGRAYEETGRLRDALAVWESRLRRMPGDASAQRHIAEIKQKIGG
jgi:predicted Zn-dependent protease